MSEFSRDFIGLESRVETLKIKFMQDQLNSEKDDPFGFNPDLEFCAAYKLLVHAEIQDYLEKKARAGLKLIEADVNEKGSNTIYLKIIIALALVFQGELNLKISHPFSEKGFGEAVTNIVHKAREFINKNNGIKNKSFTVLSIMACALKDPFDSVLIGNLDSYGESRGDVAHSSVKSVTSINSPSGEVGYVTQILQGLRTHFYDE